METPLLLDVTSNFRVLENILTVGHYYGHYYGVIHLTWGYSLDLKTQISATVAFKLHAWSHSLDWELSQGSFNGLRKCLSIKNGWSIYRRPKATVIHLTQGHSLNSILGSFT